ncbi:hypothetical protein COO60DRAFT_1701618 [Scenedesmus sp. NREL 46B-D3]|nr:hypothetical protein COO60DRAFT_1701618 [Scenedesmus sp. NREL 46B-D3]
MPGAGTRGSSRCSSSSSLPVQSQDSLGRASEEFKRQQQQQQQQQQMQPVVFEWCDMGCTVATASGSRAILQGVSGCARPRQLHGLLGPSGAGKSTLLDMLTMRLHNANCTGQLHIHGSPITQHQLANSSVYVPQFDSLVPVMTARESVEFAAAVRLPRGATRADQRARVDLVLQLMGLAEQQDMLVGGPLPGGLVLPGMSGSERKQLHIACGVVAGASLVFLDEPTTGLDSCSALSIMLFLKGMATQQGATLLASVHQPRAVIWSQLDQVTLLASGRLMYTGPTDELVPWFNSLGYPYSPEVQGTIPDWALDLVSLGFDKVAQLLPHQQEQQQTRTDSLRESFQDGLQKFPAVPTKISSGFAAVVVPSAASAVGCDAVAGDEFLQDVCSAYGSCSSGSLSTITALCQPGDEVTLMTTREQLEEAAAAFQKHLQQQQPSLFCLAAAASKDAELASAAGMEPTCAAAAVAGPPAGASAWAKYKALLWREVLVMTRNPLDVGGRMLVFTYLGLLWGLVCFDLPADAAGIYARSMVAYVTVALYLLMPYISMSLFSADKGLFAEDMAGRLYHPLQYYAAKLSLSLPFNAVLAVSFQLIFYGMAGMRRGAGVMAQSTAISLLSGLIGMQAVYCCAVLASSQDLAFVLAIAWTCPNLFVTSFMQPLRSYSLGWGMSWLRYLSPSGFAWQALLQLELAGRGFDCSKGAGLRALGLVEDLIPDAGSLRLIKQGLSRLGPNCIASGDAVIAMNMQPLPYVASVFILLGYFALLLGLTYFGIWRISKRKR